MNIPVTLLLLALGPLLLPESRNPDPHRVDIPSVALSFVGLIGVAYSVETLTGGKDIGPGLMALTVGLPAFALFFRRQLRLPTPLLDVRLFTVRYFRGAVITDLPAILAMAGALPALTQHLQLALGLSPLRTPFRPMPQAVLAAGAAFVGAALVKRHPPAHVVTGGLLTTATGFGLTVFPAPTSPPLLVATVLGLISPGAGMAPALSNDITMSSVKPERAEQAAATSETAYERARRPAPRSWESGGSGARPPPEVPRSRLLRPPARQRPNRACCASGTRSVYSGCLRSQPRMKGQKGSTLSSCFLASSRTERASAPPRPRPPNRGPISVWRKAISSRNR